nr:40S ribosomal protein S3-3-like [Tanacetum cinerariifolium]
MVGKPTLYNLSTFIPFTINTLANGVFFADLNEVLMRKLAEDGYSRVEVRVTPMRIKNNELGKQEKDDLNLICLRSFSRKTGIKLPSRYTSEIILEDGDDDDETLNDDDDDDEDKLDNIDEGEELNAHHLVLAQF